ncbi:hypothetical protein K6Y31_03355 [Motilimonas cestriensis]|uniref:Uncharacterized protein n=1 Tax=Motilimonas cestriensis TaxID=2742685 RepID=A0ABS8W6X8_9GAMM|nr:hypothetical protein [Motilimonas cestriensis]MCE2593847.1 hypothetical protein [Motilimonas cestriensis]
MSKSTKKGADKAPVLTDKSETTETKAQVNVSEAETTDAKVDAVNVDDVRADTVNTDKNITNTKAKKPNRLELDAIGFTMIITDGKAPKLSPKTNGVIFYEIAMNDDEHKLYLRMTGNDGGGLHTKSWLSLDALFEILDKQADIVFKSNVLKPAIHGKSANNASFLAAVLRCDDIGVLGRSRDNQFLHVLSEKYQANFSDLIFTICILE